MRAFHLIYMLVFVMLGGLVGEYWIRNRTWRWLVLVTPLAAGMLLVAHVTYPQSPHLEWPGVTGQNPWLEAFYWIRQNTPKSAVFAMDPNYLELPEVDQHGFRAVAERSALADNLKDSGAVSLFPTLAPEWKREVLAQTGWHRFELADFERLARLYPVTWVLISRECSSGMECPYSNQELAVCQIGGFGMTSAKRGVSMIVHHVARPAGRAQTRASAPL
jgi:hypothetical protein